MTHYCEMGEGQTTQARKAVLGATLTVRRARRGRQVDASVAGSPGIASRGKKPAWPGNTCGTGPGRQPGQTRDQYQPLRGASQNLQVVISVLEQPWRIATTALRPASRYPAGTTPWLHLGGDGATSERRKPAPRFVHA